MSLTPKNLGFFMPAEWQRHSAVWLAWPYDKTTFPGRLEKAESSFAEMISRLHESEPVKLLVLNEKMKQRAANLLRAKNANLSKITFYLTAYADVWIRDYGPIFLINKKPSPLAWVKWQYNAYGKGSDPYYTPLLLDNQVFDCLQPPGQKFSANMVLEGGAIEANGQGTLITTEQCLLNPNRNPQLSREQIEINLKNFLGVSKIIWLKEGIINDHTDGHVDDLAKFVNDATIVCAYEEDDKDPNYPILNDNLKTLEKSLDQDGNPFNLVKIPMPHINYDGGAKAPASYINFYIGNSVVLVPTFQDKNDQQALKTIKTLLPDRTVIGIDSTDLIYGGGSIHCVTQQQPKV